MAKFILLVFLPELFLGIAKFSTDLIRLVYGSAITYGVALIVGGVVVSIISLWFNLAFIRAVLDIDNGSAPEKLSVYLKKTRGFIIPAIGLTLLVSLVVLGGFILLIIPGCIFSIWFVFTLQARILDEKKGMQSLTYSKSLVSGNWWAIFFRIAVSVIFVSFLLGVFGKIIDVLFQINLNALTFQKLTIISLIATILVSFAQAALTPFATAIPTILYLDLRKAKQIPNDPLEPPTV